MFILLAFWKKLCYIKLIIKTARKNMKTLQVHFTYNNVQDFCVVKSKTKRFAMGKQMETVYALSKQLNLKMTDITLTHYYVC